MTKLEEKLNLFINSCENANIALQCVDSYAQHRALLQVIDSSKDFFNTLENIVSIMNLKEIKELNNKEDILKLYYVILRCIYVIDKFDNKYSLDERSLESAKLAKILLEYNQYYSRFSKSNNWIRNEIIYSHGIIKGFIGIHKTSIQSMLRCLTTRLYSPEIMNQNIAQYLEKFEKDILFLFKTDDISKRIYLPYI